MVLCHLDLCSDRLAPYLLCNGCSRMRRHLKIVSTLVVVLSSWSVWLFMGWTKCQHSTWWLIFTLWSLRRKRDRNRLALISWIQLYNNLCFMLLLLLVSKYMLLQLESSATTKFIREGSHFDPLPLLLTIFINGARYRKIKNPNVGAFLQKFTLLNMIEHHLVDTLNTTIKLRCWAPFLIYLKRQWDYHGLTSWDVRDSNSRVKMGRNKVFVECFCNWASVGASEVIDCCWFECRLRECAGCWWKVDFCRG